MFPALLRRGARIEPRLGAKLAVVTGASSGIGREVAIKLAGDGMDVLAVGRRAEALQQTAEQAPAAGRIFPCVADIGTEAGQAHCAETLPAGTPLHILVHNAGCFFPRTMATQDRKTYREMMCTNVEGPVFLTQELLPALRRAAVGSKGWPRILFVSSGAREMAIPTMGAYSASKAANFMIAQHMKEELEPEGIHVGACYPGLVESEITQSHMSTAEFALNDHIASRITAGDIHSAEDVASWIAALLRIGDEGCLDSETFCDRLHNIDNLEHRLGLELRTTTETALYSWVPPASGAEGE